MTIVTHVIVPGTANCRMRANLLRAVGAKQTQGMRHCQVAKKCREERTLHQVSQLHHQTSFRAMLQARENLTRRLVPTREDGARTSSATQDLRAKDTALRHQLEILARRSFLDIRFATFRGSIRPAKATCTHVAGNDRRVIPMTMLTLVMPVFCG